ALIIQAGAGDACPDIAYVVSVHKHVTCWEDKLFPRLKKALPHGGQSLGVVQQAGHAGGGDDEVRVYKWASTPGRRLH
ncbi:MAG: hypothetical protein M1835_004054, partial [Candelina submexicana]